MAASTWRLVIPPGDIPHLFVTGRYLTGDVVYDVPMDVPEAMLRNEIDGLWEQFKIPRRDVESALREWKRGKGKQEVER